MKNTIGGLRNKKGLTPRRLAEAAGTSRQQIQRIESGVQTASFPIAVAICEALEEPMIKVFPGTKNPVKKAVAGADMDTMQRFFKIRLRGGQLVCFGCRGLNTNV